MLHNSPSYIKRLLVCPPISSQSPKYRTFCQNLNLGREPQKISYERHDIESVDEKSLS